MKKYPNKARQGLAAILVAVGLAGSIWAYGQFLENRYKRDLVSETIIALELIDSRAGDIALAFAERAVDLSMQVLFLWFALDVIAVGYFIHAFFNIRK